MTENSHIQWTDHTFNPWLGCTKVSSGCTHCYAETLMDHRYGRVKWGVGQPRERTSKENWKLPIRWNRRAERLGVRYRVFCASLADWLDPEVPVEWLADLLLLIDQTPYLNWLLLTKRIDLWGDRLHDVVQQTHDGADTIASYWLDGDAPENVCLGTTVEDQPRADDRVPWLLQVPAASRFLSVEPLLEQVSLQFTPDGRNCIACEDGSHQLWECHHTLAPRPDWVIVGGESGSKARRCDVEWIRSIVKQCRLGEVPVFVKQLGSNSGQSISDCKGGNMHEFPEDLQLRQFPIIKQLAAIAK